VKRAVQSGIRTVASQFDSRRVPRRDRWQRGLIAAAALLIGCASNPQKPVAYYVPTRALDSDREQAAECFKSCQVSNATEDDGFACMKACPGIFVAAERSCEEIGASNYASCAERKESVPRSKSTKVALVVAALAAGVACFIFIQTSPSFKERPNR
jgi:hypothetical protein